METQTETVEIRNDGKKQKVPSLRIGDNRIIVTGKWLKVAAVMEEQWLKEEAIDDPQTIIAGLRQGSLHADIFTFAQRVYETRPKYDFPMAWDNVAAIPSENVTEWWQRRVSRKLRQDVAKAKRLGLDVKEVNFDDEFVKGIMTIYNESRIRQGRRFWHYGKGFADVKRENSPYLDRSQFIAAYWKGEMVGFVKIVYVGRIARFMQILSKLEHNDKRPLNALIAKAVEVCAARGCWYLVYAKYTYDGRKNSSIVDFKRRNGFQQILFPRYYVPLSLKGKAAIKLRLHLGYKRFIPSILLQMLLDCRAKLFKTRLVVPIRSETLTDSNKEGGGAA